MENKPSAAQQRPPASVYRSQQRKRRARRQKWMGLAVLAAAVVVLFVVALLFSLGGGAAPTSSVSLPPASSAPSVPPVVSSVPSSSVSVPPQRTPTEWDEEGIPALFNRFNEIPEDWALDLVSVSGGLQMSRRAGAAYDALVAAAAEDGITLVSCSGYRTNGEQTNNYNNAIQRYLNEGLSQEEAVRRTELYYAIPGTSEHEAGLAMDVNDADYPGARIDDSFAETPAYEWLQENVTRFGFIYRYQQDTTDVTHIAWEPWHYRYVGANHAEKIVELDVTLEEYVDALCRAEGLVPPVTDQVFGQAGSPSGTSGTSGSGAGGTTDTTAQIPPSMR